MAIIEIRDEEGTLLAADDDLSGVIRQLVAECSRHRRMAEARRADLLDWASREPDTSATQPGLVPVYSAGWKACQRLATQEVAARDASVDATWTGPSGQDAADGDDGWRPADTAPENGDEFWYFAQGKVRVGVLGNDMGGSIRRDPDMTHWHRKKQSYDSGHLDEAPPAPPVARRAG